MSFFDPDAPDRKPERKFPSEFGVREIRLARSVDPVHQIFVENVQIVNFFRARAKTDERKRHRREQLEIFRFFDPRSERARQTAMLADPFDQALSPEIAQHEPELQAAKPASELDAVIHLI